VGSQQSGCSCQRVTEHQPHKKDLVMSLFVHLAGRGVSPRPPPTPQPPPPLVRNRDCHSMLVRAPDVVPYLV
jgi:hypothetical protein